MEIIAAVYAVPLAHSAKKLYAENGDEENKEPQKEHGRHDWRD